MSLRIALRIAYGLVLFAGAAASAFFLLSEDLIGAFHGLANKLLTFNVAALGVFAMELLYDWKHRIKTNVALDNVEASGLPFGLYLGLRTVGLCLLAAAIFGSV